MAVAELTRKPRRVTAVAGVMIPPSRALLRRYARGGLLDRFTHAVIRATAADVGHVRVDVGIGRLWNLLQQSDSGHDHAWLTISALWHIELQPRLLHGMRAVLRQTLDRDDLLFRRDG